MSRLTVPVVLAGFFALAAAPGCGDSGDDGCPSCWEGMGGSVTFPPIGSPTRGPEPTGGSTATGGFAGSATGGLGGSDTGGLGGTLTGGVGGTAGDGATGGMLTGGIGGTGGVGPLGGTFTGGTAGDAVGGSVGGSF